MKKIFTLLAVAAMALTASAQTPASKTWNFSDWEAGDITPNTTVDGLTFTIDETAEKVSVLTIDNNKKSYDGVDYTKRIKFGGASKTTEPLNRIISFDVPGASDIKVVFTSASSSGTGRMLNIAAGTPDATISSTEAPTSGVEAAKAKYEGTTPTTIYISVTGGINVYSIAYTSDGSSAITDITVDENAPVEYFNLQGIRVDNPENGLYIKRQGNNVTKVLVK